MISLYKKRKLLIAVLLFAFLFYSVNWLVQPVWTTWNNHNTVNGFYDEPNDTVEVVFLGASMISCGVSSAQLYEEYGMCAYSLATPTQPVSASYFWLKEAYRLHNGSLKHVIMDVSMFRQTPDETFFRRAIDWMRLSPVKLEAIQTRVSSPLEALDYVIPLLSYHERWSSLSEDDFLLGGAAPVTYTRGYCFETDTVLRHFQEGTAPIPAMLTSDHQGEVSTLSADELQWLYKMIAFCKEHHLTFQLIKTPSAGNWTQAEHNAFALLATENQLVFTDFNLPSWHEELSFDPAVDCKDEKHLNYSGAAKFTSLLGSFLCSTLDITDVRQIPRYQYLKQQLADYHAHFVSLAQIKCAESIADYLSAIQNDSDFALFLLSSGKNDSFLSDLQRTQLNELGFSTLSALEDSNTYIGIFREGSVYYEGSASGKITRNGILSDGHAYQLTADKDSVSCLIEGKEYAQKGSGIRLILYKLSTHAVADQTSFQMPTSDDRINFHLNTHLQESLEQGISYEALPANQQKLWRYHHTHALLQSCAELTARYAPADSIKGLLQYITSLLSQYDLRFYLIANESSQLPDSDAETYGAELGLSQLLQAPSKAPYLAIVDRTSQFELCHSDGTPISWYRDGWSLTVDQTTGRISKNSDSYALSSSGMRLVVYDPLLDRIIDSVTLIFAS